MLVLPSAVSSTTTTTSTTGTSGKATIVPSRHLCGQVVMGMTVGEAAEYRPGWRNTTHPSPKHSHHFSLWPWSPVDFVCSRNVLKTVCYIIVGVLVLKLALGHYTGRPGSSRALARSLARTSPSSESAPVCVRGPLRPLQALEPAGLVSQLAPEPAGPKLCRAGSGAVQRAGSAVVLHSRDPPHVWGNCQTHRHQGRA